MSKLKIAVSDSCPDCFTTQRECIYINESRNIDVAAIVLSLNDVTCGKLDEIDATGYGIPVFIATENQEHICDKNWNRIPPAHAISLLKPVLAIGLCFEY